MHTDRRLNQAYRHAMVHNFNEHDRYIIFSDCHRGNGSHWDEFAKNQNIYLYALEYYYQNGFVYIEAGDGDELWENRKFADIRKAHADVFSVLKKFFYEDRLIMLYGNHNIYLKNPDYLKKHFYTYYYEYEDAVHDLFYGMQPTESVVLKYQKTGQEILVVHGQQGDLTTDQFWFFNMFSLKYFWRYLHAVGIKNPASPIRNVYRRHKVERNYVKWIEKKRVMLICGHTHRFKFPRAGEPPYFNAGCCTYPKFITGIEISDGQIQLVRWRTRFLDNGILQVKREVARGPEALEKFDMR